jgi:hypothetical protein
MTPRLAVWLLARLGDDPRLDSLTGDLIEEYQRRGSTAWLWRQVVVALLVESFRQVRDHKLLTVRAIVTPFAYGWLFPFVIELVYDPPVFRFPWFTFVNIAYAGSMGAVVAVLHRRHQLAMLLAAAVSILVMEAPELARRSMNALDHPRLVPYFVYQLQSMSVWTVSMLLGGLAVRPRRRSTLSTS